MYNQQFSAHNIIKGTNPVYQNPLYMRRKVIIMSKNKSTQSDFSNKSNNNYSNSNYNQPDFGDKPEKSTSTSSKNSDDCE